MAVISPPSSPPPSPTCRPSPLTCHHITAKTAALSPPPPQQPCHHPNHGYYSHPDPVTAATPTAPFPPVSPGPHLQRHPSYTSTSSMYLFKCQIYHFLCMNVTNLV